MEIQFHRRNAGAYPVFYARGAFHFRKLKLADKMMMRLLRRKLKRMENLNQDDRELLASYDHPTDWTQRENIEPVIACIRESDPI